MCEWYCGACGESAEQWCGSVQGMNSSTVYIIKKRIMQIIGTSFDNKLCFN